MKKKKEKKAHTGKIILVLLVLIIIFAAIILIRTVTYPFAKSSPDRKDMLPARVMPSVKALERLAGGVRIPTVSDEIGRAENNPFDRFKTYLADVYPQVYANMDTMTINGYGMLFRWKGRDSSLDPILFLSHYDVVPVIGYEAETDPGEVIFRPDDKLSPALDEFSSEWDYHPFSGAVVDGRVYGRGTLDMKGMLFGIMEAIDELLAAGFRPERDIWLAFGHDEEISGLEGAVHIANYFKEQGMTFEGVYDEGGVVAAPGLGGINTAMALIGTAEKGFLTLRIKVYGTGGHSSMPPAKGSLVYAAEIMQKLNENQVPARLIPPISSFLDNVGGFMNFGSRMAIANKWLFKNMLFKSMAKTPATNALTRTTTAVTMAKGSDAPNVLASVAEVVVNYRILTGESVADIVAHVEKICEGYDTEIEIVSSREPSNTSEPDSRAYGILKESLEKLYPGAVITPYLTIGGTDAYKYEIVSNKVYRMTPIYLNEYEQRTVHNENEFISLDNFGRMIAHFKYIMENF